MSYSFAFKCLGPILGSNRRCRSIIILAVVVCGLGSLYGGYLVLFASQMGHASQGPRLDIPGGTSVDLGEGKVGQIVEGSLALHNVGDGQGDRMSRIVENVKANEELYRNIEVIEVRRYRLDEGAPRMDENSIVNQDGKRRSVLQKNLFYLQEEMTRKLEGGALHKGSSTEGYDGEVTRLVEMLKTSDESKKTSPIANIYNERREERRLFIAHSWALFDSSYGIPLSFWLRGGEDLASHPNAQSSYTYIAKCSFDSEEQVDGMTTVKLRLEHVERNEQQAVNTLDYIWLATDRNYMPVKGESYFPDRSLTLPVETVRATDFREISPGVWLPFRAIKKVFGSHEAEKGTIVLRNTTERWLEKASLDPNYDISLFRDIPFLDGTVVYEVNNGEVGKGWVHRVPQTGYSWLIYGGIAGIAIIALLAVFAIRKRSNTRRAVP